MYDFLCGWYIALCRMWGAIPRAVRIASVASTLASLALLMLALAATSPQGLIFGDGIGYVQLAEHLRDGKGYVYFFNGEYVPETFRTPGVSGMMALFFWFGLGLVGYLYFIVLVSAPLVPILTWYIGRELFSPSVGIVAAWLMAAEPLILLYRLFFHSEAPFTLLSLVAVALFVRSRTHGGLGWVAGAGVAVAASIYVKPSAALLYVASFILIGIFDVVRRQMMHVVHIGFLGMVITACLLPWIFWMHSVTGVYALSGTGWRNVYTDYLASLRALDNGTEFLVEKNALKDYAQETWGLSRVDINSPAHAATLRDYALPEIFERFPTAVKLQSMLFVTYFTHNAYLTMLRYAHMVDAPPPRLSSSRTLLERPIAGIPVVYEEMKRRYFVPVLERVWSFSLFVLACVGYVVSRGRIRHLLLLIIMLGYVSASAIGLGVEGRLRIPIMPFYFMLVAAGALWAVSYIRGRKWIRL